MTALAQVIDDIADGVAAAHDELNRLDAAAGDGDLGNTVVAVAKAIRAAIASDPSAAPAALLGQCGTEIAIAAPSTAGTLIARALLAASGAITSAPAGPPVAVLHTAVAAATTAIESAGKATVGDKTMLDALAPAAEALSAQAQAGAELPAALSAAAAAARRGAEETKKLTPRAGRARWLAERSKGTEDAGAHLVALVLELAASSLHNHAGP